MTQKLTESFQLRAFGSQPTISPQNFTLAKLITVATPLSAARHGLIRVSKQINPDLSAARPPVSSLRT
jgi:hypothetical protein